MTDPQKPGRARRLVWVHDGTELEATVGQPLRIYRLDPRTRERKGSPKFGWTVTEIVGARTMWQIWRRTSSVGETSDGYHQPIYSSLEAVRESKLEGDTDDN
jgi:hypothetical protein